MEYIRLIPSVSRFLLDIGWWVTNSETIQWRGGVVPRLPALFGFHRDEHRYTRRHAAWVEVAQRKGDKDDFYSFSQKHWKRLGEIRGLTYLPVFVALLDIETNVLLGGDWDSLDESVVELSTKPGQVLVPVTAFKLLKESFDEDQSDSPGVDDSSTGMGAIDSARCSNTEVELLGQAS